MAMTVEQLVEFVLIEAFPGQSQNQKQAFRYELEAMVPSVLRDLALMVAASRDYQLLQRAIVLPVLNSREIDYDQFGNGVGGALPIINNGIIFGDNGAYALSPQRLTLSGSPLRVRSQFVEWQWITVKNNASAGVIGLFPTAADIADPTLWDDLVRVGTAFSTGDGFFDGVHYAGALALSPGDYLRFQWDANGDLSIVQYDANRTVITTYPATGGDVTRVAIPGVVFFGDGGQISVGRIGTGTSHSTTPTLTDGFYRADLGTTYDFLTSTFDHTGTLRFQGTNRQLSWVPSLSYQSQPLRCDTWYWTLEGEQIVFWPGKVGESLPSQQLSLSGNIIPQAPDLPSELNQRAISMLIDRIRSRNSQQARRK